MLWSGIRSIVNMKTKSQLSQISDLLKNGKQVDDPVKMANMFNNYFVNVGGNIDKSIPRTRKSPMDYLCNRTPISIFLAPVTEREIEIIIESLNQKKAIGPYSIPVFLLKILCRYIAVPLSKIVDQSFETGIFPHCLKIGKVNPLTRRILVRILPIIGQSQFFQFFSKLSEKLMHKWSYYFLGIYEILYPLQFGFHEKHSTSNALLSLTESIKLSIDNGKFDCGIFLDLQKAIDTVNHSILLQKLEHYGIRDNALQWFKSYLNERSQYVTVNGHASEMLPITCRVPQGLVRGSLLFFIYVNDLPNVSKFLRFYLQYLQITYSICR